MRFCPPEDGAKRDKKGDMSHEASPGYLHVRTRTEQHRVHRLRLCTSQEAIASLLRRQLMLVEAFRSMHDPFEQLDEFRSLQQNAKLAVAGWLAVRDWLSICTVQYSAAYTGTCTPPIRTLLYAGDLMFHWLASMSVPFPSLPLLSPSSTSHAFAVRAGYACLRQDNGPPLSSAQYGHHKVPLPSISVFIYTYEVTCSPS